VLLMMHQHTTHLYAACGMHILLWLLSTGKQDTAPPRQWNTQDTMTRTFEPFTRNAGSTLQLLIMYSIMHCPPVRLIMHPAPFARLITITVQ
jgi:hypothetical protein